MKKFANVALVVLVMVSTSLSLNATVESNNEDSYVAVGASEMQFVSINSGISIGSVPGK